MENLLIFRRKCECPNYKCKGVYKESIRAEPQYQHKTDELLTQHNTCILVEWVLRQAETVDILIDKYFKDFVDLIW